MNTIIRNSAITILLTASFTLNGMNNADQAFITAAVQALESIKLEVNVLEMNNGIDDATRKSIDDATIKMITRLYQETHNEQYKALQNLNDKACDLSVSINELSDSMHDLSVETKNLQHTTSEFSDLSVNIHELRDIMGQLSIATKDLRHAVTSNGQTVDTQEETRNDGIDTDLKTYVDINSSSSSSSSSSSHNNDNNNNNSTPAPTTASTSTWLLSMMGYN